MKVLITGARSRISRIIAEGLGGQHDLTLTDIESATGVVPCDLGHDESTDRLVQGIEAIVHPSFEAQAGDAPYLIDYHTRRTYNLLLAASQAGVRRVVNISTLRLFEGYEENLTVTERWRPLPVADDPQILACHLGEIVCKEFARDRLVQVINLRLGFPVLDGGPESAAAAEEPAAIDAQTVESAVRSALVCDASQWQDVHVQAKVPNQRYLLHAARDILGLETAGADGGSR